MRLMQDITMKLADIVKKIPFLSVFISSRTRVSFTLSFIFHVIFFLFLLFRVMNPAHELDAMGDVGVVTQVEQKVEIQKIPEQKMTKEMLDFIEKTFKPDVTNLEEKFIEPTDNIVEDSVLSSIEGAGREDKSLERMVGQMGFGDTFEKGNIGIGDVGLAKGKGPLGVSGRAGIFGARGGKGKKTAIKEYGGSAETESAVSSGLEYLYKHQGADGSWDCDTGYGQQGRMATTSMALLAFLGVGYAPTSHHKYAGSMRGAIGYLQNNSGKDPYGGGMYSHAIVTMALAETYAVAGLASLRPIVKHGAEAIVGAQRIGKDKNFSGGWRYTLDAGDSDLSVTGWQVMALKSAYNSGITVEDKVFKQASNFIRKCATADSGFAYQPGGAANSAMTAAGTLALIFCGQLNEPGVRSAVQRLSSTALPTTAQQDVYAWYYATQAIFQANPKGPTWKTWNEAMSQLLTREQAADGSWNFSASPHVGKAGPNLVTAMCVLILEVYYRYLPIYSTDEPAAKAEEKSGKE